MKDVFILVADQDMLSTMEGLIPRIPVVNREIAPFSYQIEKHPLRDPGCLKHSSGFLRPFVDGFQYVIVLLDHEGCGRESDSPSGLQEHIERDLSINGWEGRCKAIVIEPELEQWIWADSPKVSEAIGWGSQRSLLNDWLIQKEFLTEGEFKPKPPKEALELALREKRIPRSSAIYRKIAATASYRDCEVPSFLGLLDILRKWFPSE